MLGEIGRRAKPHLDSLVVLAGDELVREGVQREKCRGLRVEYFLQLVGGYREHLVRGVAGIDRGEEIYEQGVLGRGGGVGRGMSRG